MVSQPKTLSDLKAGDEVFVVFQGRRGGYGGEREVKDVVRVGRKYGYIHRYGRDLKFNLEHGRSEHGDDNARINGYGFDVYLCEQDYISEQLKKAEMNQLSNRIVSSFGRLVNIPSEAVAAINKILDDAGVEG